MKAYKVKARLARNIGTDDFALETFDKSFESNTPISSRKDAFNYYFNIIDVINTGEIKDDISSILKHINNAQKTYFDDNGKLNIKRNKNAPEDLGLGVYLIIDDVEYMIHGYNDYERELDIARNLVREKELYVKNNWDTSNWITVIKYWDYELATSSKDGIFEKEVLWTSMDFWEHGKPELFIDIEEEAAQLEADSLLKNIIEKGENRNLEFKSSLRYCYNQKSSQKYIEHEIIKTIGAFANTEGGTLIIGVDDDGNILGLKNDFNSFNNNQRDKFLKHFANLIGDGFTEPVDALIKYDFENSHKAEVFVVIVEKSSTPRFIKTKGGGKEFYIRRTATSKKLDVEEAVKYCFDNWAK